MVKDYEDSIIPPPPQFRNDYKPIPAPRTKPRDWTQRPIPAPRTKFTETIKALSGYTKSYEVSIRNDEDPLIQLHDTRLAIEYNLKKILHEITGLTFVETLKINFEKQERSQMIEKIAYFNSSAQTIINGTEIGESLQITQNQIISKIQQWISEGSAWLIQSVDSCFINVVKYQPMKGSSYIP